MFPTLPAPSPAVQPMPPHIPPTGPPAPPPPPYEEDPHAAAAAAAAAAARGAYGMVYTYAPYAAYPGQVSVDWYRDEHGRVVSGSSSYMKPPPQGPGMMQGAGGAAGGAGGAGGGAPGSAGAGVGGAPGGPPPPPGAGYMTSPFLQPMHYPPMPPNGHRECLVYFFV